MIDFTLACFWSIIKADWLCVREERKQMNKIKPLIINPVSYTIEISHRLLWNRLLRKEQYQPVVGITMVLEDGSLYETSMTVPEYTRKVLKFDHN